MRGGRRGGVGNAADVKHDIPRAPLFIEPTLRAGRGRRICMKKQWTVGSDSQANAQIPTAHASTTAFRACGIHHVPKKGGHLQLSEPVWRMDT